MASTLTADQHAHLTRILTEWGVADEEIADVLADASFGPGVIGIQPDSSDLPLSVGILIDTEQDPEIGALLSWRGRTSDEALAAGLEVARVTAEAILCPHAPEALLAYTIELARPWVLRRTFLLQLSKRPDVYIWLARPGSTVWLVPQDIVIRGSAQEGAGTAHDIWKDSLPIAETTHGSSAVAEALAHLDSDLPAEQASGADPDSPFPETAIDEEPYDSDEEDERAQTRSWEEIRAEHPIDQRAMDFYGRISGLESMLRHLCIAYGADELAVMQAAGVMHEDSFAPIPDYGDGLYIARVGKAVAQIGGHLELHAIFPDVTHLLLAEPTVDQPDSQIPNDEHHLIHIPAEDQQIGWRASPHRYDGRFAHASNDSLGWNRHYERSPDIGRSTPSRSPRRGSSTKASASH